MNYSFSKNVTILVTLLIVLGVMTYFFKPEKKNSFSIFTSTSTSMMKGDLQNTLHMGVIKKATAEELLQGALIDVPDFDTTVTLQNGSADFQIEGSGVSGTVTVGKPIVEKGNDVFAVGAVNGGGSGTFEYVFLFKRDGDTLVHTSSLLVGDRVEILSISISPSNLDYIVTINYLDRAEGDAMVVEPTIKKEKTVGVFEGMFIDEIAH